MTVTVTAATRTKQMHNTLRDSNDFHSRLDRFLARKYVQEYLVAQRERRRNMSPEELQMPQLWQPRMQLCDDPQSTRVSATLEVPGLHKDDIVIERQGDKLIVSGERRSPFPPNVGTGGEPDSNPNISIPPTTSKYPVQEFKYGKYRRVINIAPGTQDSTLSCSLKDGLFVVSWPRTPAVPISHNHRAEPQRPRSDSHRSLAHA